MSEDKTEHDICIKENETSKLFGSLPDARPVQRNLITKYPLKTSILGELKFSSEGRSFPSVTPESLFPYYLNNYEVTSRYLENLRQELDRPLKILEIGCGTGWGSRLLKDNLPDSEIIATNRVVNNKDKVTIDMANRIFATEGLTFEEADVSNLIEKFNEESFDAVVMLEVIEHLPSEFHSKIAKEVSQVLKSGGEFIVSTPSAEGYGQTESAPQSKDHVWIYGNRQDIINTLSPNFSDIEVNRIVNSTHTHTFGRNTIKQHFYSLGVIKAPDSMFTGYSYEKGNSLTDDKHVREQDTCTWFSVARKDNIIIETGSDL